MEPKIRIELSKKDLHDLLFKLPKRDHDNEIREALAEKYLKSVSPDLSVAFAAAQPGGDPLMQFIVHTLSLITGVPENQITPSTKLGTLGLSQFKLEQLRAFLNKYISAHGGHSYIAPTDMTALKTVQDIYILVQSKLP